MGSEMCIRDRVIIERFFEIIDLPFETIPYIMVSVLYIPSTVLYVPSGTYRTVKLRALR